MRGTLGLGNLGFFAAFALIASGCVTMRPYDPGPGKRVAAGFVQDTYLSGEFVNVTISNLSDVMLFYPDRFCKTVLQKRDGTEWKTVSGPSAGCSVSRGFLDPGQTVASIPPAAGSRGRDLPSHDADAGAGRGRCAGAGAPDPGFQGLHAVSLVVWAGRAKLEPCC
ncbi:MAG TPA: hypothetical protein VF962_02580 [Gemmatimonadaceae bacterium]